MNEKDRFEIQLSKIRRYALLAGVIAAVIAVAGALLTGVGQFFQSYLYAYLFWLGISLGCLAFAMLHLLVGGRWGIPLRRLLAASSKNIALMAVLFIPVILGLRYLFPWANPEVVAADPLIQHKSIYLNIPFFIIRALLFFAIWIALTTGMSRWTERSGQEAGSELKSRYQRFSAFGMILFVLSMTFASVDWIMSLQPHFFSTIYGILIISGQALSGLAFVIAVLPWFARQEPLSAIVSPHIYRDLGAFLLTTVTLWAYLAFSQYFIIWSGNLPEEIEWYLDRTRNGWQWLAYLVILFQFFFPFWVLISLRAKRSLRVLATVAGVIIVLRLVDNFWEVTPAFHPQGITIHWLDGLTPIAIGGLWIGAFIWNLERTPIYAGRELEGGAAVASGQLEVGAHE